MSAPVDVLAVMRGWDVGLTHDLTCLEVEIVSGNVTGYEKELEDRTNWVREAREARAAVAELIEMAGDAAYRLSRSDDETDRLFASRLSAALARVFGEPA